MSTTRLMPLHAGKGKTIAAALGRTTDYVENPNKTHGGEFILAYECDPLTITEEFMFSKIQYELMTGRTQSKEHDVIAYHLRQSFKPGEITPELAGQIAYDTLMSLTKGKHAFLICVHVDKEHIHTHSVYNSTTLDCKNKFRNFKNSAFAVRKISDLICLQNSLSIIENPKPSRGSYATWLGEKPPTKHDQLLKIIDENCIIGRSYQDFLTGLKRSGCELKVGKQLSVKIPGAKKFIRFDTLGDDYSDAAIMEKLRGVRDVPSWKKDDADAERKAVEYIAKQNAQLVGNAPNLLIDIQSKIREGAGDGYVRWMQIFNLKAAARTLIFLQENNIDSYDDLRVKSAIASSEFANRGNKLHEIEAKQKDITELQRQIGAYNKTRVVYQEYKAIKKPKKQQEFYECHRAAIDICRAAKKYFNEQKLDGKLPPIATLKQEWATLDSEKKLLYKDYHALTPRHKELQTALMNAQNILDIDASGQIREQTYDQSQTRQRTKSHIYDAR